MRQSFTSFAALACATFCLSAVAADGPVVEHLNSGKVYPGGVPFSEAVKVGDTLYLSGQIGVKPGKLELVPGGIREESRQTLQNLRTTLEAHGYALRDVVNCTVMLADIAKWGEFNDIYKTFFTAPYPARSALGTSGLALGAQVELECVAVKRESAATRAGDEKALREIKEVLWPRAYFTQDAALLDRILADEFESIDGDGNLSTKKAELEWIAKNKPNYDSLTFAIRRLEIFDNGTAIVSGTGTIRGKDEKGAFRGEYQSSNIFIKRGGQWRAVASHVSGYRQQPGA